jgi:hypothetical protein
MRNPVDLAHLFAEALIALAVGLFKVGRIEGAIR